MFKLKSLKLNTAKALLFIALASALAWPQQPFLSQAVNCTQPQIISFPYAVQSSPEGTNLKANAVVNGDVYSNGNILGEYFAKINGSAWAAGQISKTKVTGDAHENAAPGFLPGINLSDWQQAATLGGQMSGDVVYGVNSMGNTLGPALINGNLVLMENSEVFLKGNIYVTGDITISKNAKFVLEPAFGSLGTVVVAGGKVRLDGNAQVSGNGGDSFLALVSTDSSGGDAILVERNFFSGSTIFYAMNGGLNVGDNANIIAAYGKNVIIGRNSQVNFVAGLKAASFICPQPPAAAPRLTASKTPSKLLVLPGEIYSYNLNIKNTGTGTATAVSIVDDLPAAVDFYSSAPAISASSTSGSQVRLTWQAGDLAAGAELSVDLKVKVKLSAKPGSGIVNSIKVSRSGLSGGLTATSPAVNVQSLAATADLEAFKTADKQTASEGEEIIYHLSVKNNGPSLATGVLATETLPTLLEFLAATSSPGTTYATSTGLWTIGNLASGTTASLQIKTKLKSGSSGQTITNSFIVSAKELDPNTANNSPAVSVAVAQSNTGGSSGGPPAGSGGGGSSGGGGYTIVTATSTATSTGVFVGLKYQAPDVPESVPAPKIITKKVSPPAKQLAAIAKTPAILGQATSAPQAVIPEAPACRDVNWWVLGFVLYALLMLLAAVIWEYYHKNYFILFPAFLFVCSLIWWWLEPCPKHEWYWPALCALMFLSVIAEPLEKYLAPREP